tara:strand:- start:213 stop:635 length:423 start_codon:yes stop_codon:yes gene_type:complete
MTKRKEKSLYERLGGRTAIDGVVKIFYSKAIEDKSINHFFEGGDMKSQLTQQKAFLSNVFGSSVHYSGPTIQEINQQLEEITEDHFNSVAGHLISSLKEYKVPQELIDEVVTLALSLKDDVLAVHSIEEENIIQSNKTTN